MSDVWGFESHVTNIKPRTKKRDKIAHEMLTDAMEYMSDEHKEYLDALYNGEEEVDALKILEILSYYELIYVGVAMKDVIEQKKISRDLASVLGELRQTAKEVEDIKGKRKIESEKIRVKEEQFDPTTTSALSRFESLHGE
jgi:hypothetical protein